MKGYLQVVLANSSLLMRCEALQVNEKLIAWSDNWMMCPLYWQTNLTFPLPHNTLSLSTFSCFFTTFIYSPRFPSTWVAARNQFQPCEFRFSCGNAFKIFSYAVWAAFVFMLLSRLLLLLLFVVVAAVAAFVRVVVVALLGGPCFSAALFTIYFVMCRKLQIYEFLMSLFVLASLAVICWCLLLCGSAHTHTHTHKNTRANTDRYTHAPSLSWRIPPTTFPFVRFWLLIKFARAKL